jgi:hypothetical protein
MYLTGNPQITFFKIVYRRHTNFSMEAIEQTFNGTADFGRTVSATISRNGDLIHRMYVQATIPEVTVATAKRFRWMNWLGHVLLETVELEIGGQKIDKHYGDWLHIWNELTQTAGHQAGYANMVGNVPKLTQYTSNADTSSVELYIPLQFWFNRNPGLALPLIALQYHEVKINIKFRQATDCYHTTDTITTPALTSASLWVDYVYLDTEERRRFAQVSHEYLIEQLQFTGDESTSASSTKVKMAFNHPVKELIWVAQRSSHITTDTDYGGFQWFNYTDRSDPTYFSGTPSDPLGGGMGTAAFHSGNFPYSLPFSDVTTASADNAGIEVPQNSIMDGTRNPGVVTFDDLLNQGAATTSSQAWLSELTFLDIGENPVQDAKIQLNGHDRFAKRNGRYFNLVQPYQHHENIPATGINVYSFALKPEDHQPSGSCNFSRIDTATLHLTLTTNAIKKNDNAATENVRIRVYAVNYNVLRIMSGMGGLAYSN